MNDVIVIVRDAATRTAVRAVTPRHVPVADGEADSRADVVIVAAGVRLAPTWLEALIAACGDDGTVATVDAVVLDVATPVVVSTSEGRRPTGGEPGWKCTLVTRAALDLAGPLDHGFAARCVAHGLRHVVASDVIAAGPEPAGDVPPSVARARSRGCVGLCMSGWT